MSDTAFGAKTGAALGSAVGGLISTSGGIQLSGHAVGATPAVNTGATFGIAMSGFIGASGSSLVGRAIGAAPAVSTGSRVGRPISGPVDASKGIVVGLQGRESASSWLDADFFIKGIIVNHQRRDVTPWPGTNFPTARALQVTEIIIATEYTKLPEQKK